MKVYVMGSLRNPQVALLGNFLREKGIEPFDDWFAGGPEADDYWQKYEETRGRTYPEALYGPYAANIFDFDRKHLDESDAGILVMPAGKSAHLELGYLAGQGKPTFVLFDKVPERWDVMYLFCTKVCFSTNQLWSELAKALK